MSLTTVELTKKSDEDLAALLTTQRQQLLDLRFSHSTGALENTAQVSQLKRDIARVRTAQSTRRAAATAAAKVTTS